MTTEGESSSGLPKESGTGSGWEPDDFLEPYAAENFEVEKHATEILQAGNINEEVGPYIFGSVVYLIVQRKTVQNWLSKFESKSHIISNLFSDVFVLRSCGHLLIRHYCILWASFVITAQADADFS
jgi:hypothetical protein